MSSYSVVDCLQELGLIVFGEEFLFDLLLFDLSLSLPLLLAVSLLATGYKDLTLETLDKGLRMFNCKLNSVRFTVVQS